jgi:hypothetical protein
MVDFCPSRARIGSTAPYTIILPDASVDMALEQGSARRDNILGSFIVVDFSPSRARSSSTLSLTIVLPDASVDMTLEQGSA